MKNQLITLTAVTLLLGSGPTLAQSNTPVASDYRVTATPASNADEADRQVIAQLKAQGSDITQPTDVIFYLYFPTKSDAQAIGEKAAANGFTIDVHRLEGSKEWSLVANKTMVPSEDAIIAASHQFAEWAKSRNGIYDGWEAALVR